MSSHEICCGFRFVRKLFLTLRLVRCVPLSNIRLRTAVRGPAQNVGAVRVTKRCTTYVGHFVEKKLGEWCFRLSRLSAISVRCHNSLKIFLVPKLLYPRLRRYAIAVLYTPRTFSHFRPSQMSPIWLVPRQEGTMRRSCIVLCVIVIIYI